MVNQEYQSTPLPHAIYSLKKEQTPNKALKGRQKKSVLHTFQIIDTGFLKK